MLTTVKTRRHETPLSRAFDSFFLHKGEEGIQAFTEQASLVASKLEKVFREVEEPFIGKSPETMKRGLSSVLTIPEEAHPISDVLNEIEGPVLKASLYVSHERSMAHLHCPPILPGILAELIIGALNQSMDSWDQSPAATYVEEELVRQLVEIAGYPETADGVFTSGGTQSNYMGLLLARDHFCLKTWNHNVQANGLPKDLHRMRVLCSEEAHFSVTKSVSQLGLGAKSVVPIRTDARHKMDVNHLKVTIEQLKEEGMLPFAVAATCGTTDFGSIDPMNEIADACVEHDLWLHVDAAYGGGLLFSPAYKNKLDGLSHADSVTLDFHKLCYQPISCGLFLVKNRNHFKLLSHHADYLNPKEDDDEGILNLVSKSVQTTRRFDALKVLLTLKTVGTNILGSMLDETIELARFAAGELKDNQKFLLESDDPELTTIVFQYQTGHADINSEINRKIQQALYNAGKAVMAKTSVNGETYLKFTLLNPRTTKEDVRAVIGEIEQMGEKLMNGGTHQ